MDNEVLNSDGNDNRLKSNISYSTDMESGQIVEKEVYPNVDDKNNPYSTYEGNNHDLIDNIDLNYGNQMNENVSFITTTDHSEQSTNSFIIQQSSPEVYTAVTTENSTVTNEGEIIYTSQAQEVSYNANVSESPTVTHETTVTYIHTSQGQEVSYDTTVPENTIVTSETTDVIYTSQDPEVSYHTNEPESTGIITETTETIYTSQTREDSYDTNVSKNLTVTNETTETIYTSQTQEDSFDTNVPENKTVTNETAANSDTLYTSQTEEVAYDPNVPTTEVETPLITTEVNYVTEQVVSEDLQYIPDRNSTGENEFVSEYVLEMERNNTYSEPNNFEEPSTVKKENESFEEFGNNAEEIRQEIMSEEVVETVTEITKMEEPEMLENAQTPQILIAQDDSHQVIEDNLPERTLNDFVEETQILTEETSRNLEDNHPVEQQINEEILPDEDTIPHLNAETQNDNQVNVENEIIENVEFEEPPTLESQIESNEENVSLQETSNEGISEVQDFTENISNEKHQNIVKISQDILIKAAHVPDAIIHDKLRGTSESIVDKSIGPTETINEEVIENKDDILSDDYKMSEEVEVTYLKESEPKNILKHPEEIATSDDSQETVLLIECADDPDCSIESITEESKLATPQAVKRARGRPKGTRSSLANIPLHVLGVDVKNPIDATNGVKLPRPRLGVKVPPRNLTSQIVSKADLQKEIMDRSRIKEEQQNDTMFARSLTHRLATKINQDPKSPKSAPQPTPKPTSKSNNNEDNSDLLAILEGDGQVDDPIESKTEVNQDRNEDKDMDETNLKLLEREIALQQLQDLPRLTPKKYYKVRHTGKTETATYIRPMEDMERELKSPKTKDNVERVVEDLLDEPHVKVNMVLKTYSRKRKSIENLEASPQKKSIPSKEEVIKPEVASTPSESNNSTKGTKVAKIISQVNLPSNVYMTKSSRIIKKKVVWDPDDTPTKPSTKVIKIEHISVEPKSAVSKIIKVEKKDKEKSPKRELETNKIEKKVIEKVQEKKSVEGKVEKSSPVTKKELIPKKTKSPLHKKRLTEVDKLLMDEGAVNMIYEVKNTEEGSEPKKKHKLISVDRANKEMMKRAKEIKNDLQQNTDAETPKSLRKKESIPIPIVPNKSPILPGHVIRKLSKDSRGSLHTPPASPAYSYPETSRLIRRRSSSSMSSADEIEDEDLEIKSKKKSPVAANVEPKPKKQKRTAKETDTSVSDSDTSVTKDKEPAKKPSPDKQFSYKSFTIKKTNKLTIINLNYINEECYCTIQVLKELINILNRLAKDKDCLVVCITSSSKAFCLGVNYKYLVGDTDEARKKKATELSGYIQDFLKCLLNFPKILVAGIEGSCEGLGVTMLPLFDMVIASDSATFSTPYSTLGCAPEAGFLLTAPHIANPGLSAEILYTSNKIKADDAFRRGLITRLCWPEKYHDELKSILTSITNGSKQSLETTKKQLRSYLLPNAEAAINSESKTMVELWTSAECQKNFTSLA